MRGLTLRVEKARRDLSAAKILMASEERSLDIVVYHCQQAAEKGLKAVLVARGVDFPKTHDLRALLKLLGGVEKFREHVVVLNPYAAEFRYPGDFVEPLLGDAKMAVRLATEIFASSREEITVPEEDCGKD